LHPCEITQSNRWLRNISDSAAPYLTASFTHILGRGRD
jgi:hypothetical protein